MDPNATLDDIEKGARLETALIAAVGGLLRHGWTVEEIVTSVEESGQDFAETGEV